MVAIPFSSNKGPLMQEPALRSHSDVNGLCPSKGDLKESNHDGTEISNSNKRMSNGFWEAFRAFFAIVSQGISHLSRSNEKFNRFFD
jgi:hypothetical protein